MPSYYITTYSTTILSWPSSTGNIMLAINNGVNAISRIFMGLFADTFGRQNTMVSSVRIWFVPMGKMILTVCRVGNTVRFVCFRALVWCGSSSLYSLCRRLRDLCWWLQCSPPDHHHRSIRSWELYQSKWHHIFYSRAGSHIRSSFCWVDFRKSQTGCSHG